MTREEEIRNAVDTTIPILPSNDGITYEQALMATGFEAGVKWADKNPNSPWISVDEDLPCNHEELMSKDILFSHKETVRVLTLQLDGDVETDFMVHYKGEWKWWSNRRHTHWFSIPKLSK